MEEKDKKIEELERQLDELLTEKYENEKQERFKNVIHTELELLVRNLYRESKEILKEDKEMDARDILKNLTKNIENFSREYNWPLKG